MGKKLFLLVLYINFTLLAHACAYTHTGVNELYQLLKSVTDQNGNDLPNIPDYYIVNNNTEQTTANNKDKVQGHFDATRLSRTICSSCGETSNDSVVTNNQDGRWNYPGTNWTVVSSDDVIYLQSGYFLQFLTSIDWSDSSYIQRPGSPIVWQQPDIYGAVDGSNDYKNDVQDRDLSYLNNLNFSGNKFYHFELDGAGTIPITNINFSNNPGLETLIIKNCPNLIDVDISNSGLRLSKIYDISQTVDAKLIYAPQGTVSLSFPINAVDLSADLTLGGVATTITWEDDQPVADNNGVFTFDASLAGHTVTAILSNSKLSDFKSDGLRYEISLTNSSTDISTIQTDAERVYSANGQLFIKSNVSGTASIYLIDGSLVKVLNITPGTSCIALPSNIYIVRFADGIAQKVVVK